MKCRCGGMLKEYRRVKVGGGMAYSLECQKCRRAAGIRELLAKHGVVTIKDKQIHVEDVLKMRRIGMSYAQISKKLSIGETTAWRIGETAREAAHE